MENNTIDKENNNAVDATAKPPPHPPPPKKKTKKKSEKIDEEKKYGIPKPKRFLTAYNFFFMNERANVINDASSPTTTNGTTAIMDKSKPWTIKKVRKEHIKTHGKIPFSSLGKLVASKWKQLGEEEKKVYVELAKEDLKRYQVEFKEYKRRIRLAQEKELEEKKEGEASVIAVEKKEAAIASTSSSSAAITAKRPLTPSSSLQRQLVARSVGDDISSSPPRSKKLKTALVPTMTVSSSDAASAATMTNVKKEEIASSTTKTTTKTLSTKNDAPSRISTTATTFQTSTLSSQKASSTTTTTANKSNTEKQSSSRKKKSTKIRNRAKANTSTNTKTEKAGTQEEEKTIIHQSTSTKVTLLHNSPRFSNLNYVIQKERLIQSPHNNDNDDKYDDESNTRQLSKMENEYKISLLLYSKLQCRQVIRCAIKLEIEKKKERLTKQVLYSEYVPGVTLKEYIASTSSSSDADNDSTTACHLQLKPNALPSSTTTRRRRKSNAVINKQKIKIALAIVKAIRKIHDAGVVHNKITDENILLVQQPPQPEEEEEEQQQQQQQQGSDGDDNREGKEGESGFRVKIIDLSIACALESNQEEKEEDVQKQQQHDFKKRKRKSGNSKMIQNDLHSLGLVFNQLFYNKAPPCTLQNEKDAYVEMKENGNGLSKLVFRLMETKEEGCYRSILEVENELWRILEEDCDEKGLLIDKNNDDDGGGGGCGGGDGSSSSSNKENKEAKEEESKNIKTPARPTFQPSKLYGRNPHISVIMDAYKRAAQQKTTQNNNYYYSNAFSSFTSEMVVVTGSAGSGKTALVHHIRQKLIEEKQIDEHYFLCGKFDYFRQMEPLSAIVLAFAEFCNHVVMDDKKKGEGSEETLRKIRSSIEDIVGSEVNVLANVIPGFNQIISTPQVDTVRVSGKEKQRRLKYVFQLFVRAIATSTSHPLVLFLDDLQWADQLSLDLIESLITDSENKSILLIGSYRSDEANTQLLEERFGAIEHKLVNITRIGVGNLNK